MKDDDLYPRYQTLAALINVLLHDLRNPLHSATLLVEAMGSRSADVDALRGKLRGQFGKLEGLISESSDAIKGLALEARIEDVAVDDIVRIAAESARQLAGLDVELVAGQPTGLRASTDVTLIVRAIGEITATLAERALNRNPNERVRLTVAIDEPDREHVRLVVGGWSPPSDDAAVKAPFAITGGGVRLAVARSLSQVAGATLRLEQSPEGAIRYAVHLARPGTGRTASVPIA